MQRVGDLEAGHVDVDRGRNRLGRAAHLDRVRHDVDGAAALDARRLVGVDDVDRDLDANLRAFAEPEKIHMDRRVANRIELVVARDHAVLDALDLEIVQGGEEVSRIDALPDVGAIERDRQRRFAVTIDHARHAAGTTLRPGGPLAGLRTRRRFEFLDGRHVGPLRTMEKGGATPLRVRGMPPGVSGPRIPARRPIYLRARGLIAAGSGKNKQRRRWRLTSRWACCPGLPDRSYSVLWPPPRAPRPAPSRLRFPRAPAAPSP